MKRREFLKTVGGGIFIFFNLEASLVSQQARRFQREYPTDFNAYLRIGEDGRVTCFSGKIEMGQGVITSLAQMLAEELDVPLDVVDMVMGDTALCPWDMGTFGSRSTKYFGPSLRQAGAEARAVLLQLAAEHLHLPLQGLTVKDGVIFQKSDPQKKVAYADLAKGKRIEQHVQGEVSIKHYSKHTISGKPTDRMDGRQKVTGASRYAGDIRVPGMLYAKILRPPVHGARLKSLDTSAAKKIPGVQIVRDKDLLAVVHQHPDEAEKALQKIKAQFELPGRKLNNQNIFQYLLKAAPAAETVTQSGSIKEGKDRAVKTFTARYCNHYVAHAPLEPHTALASVEGDKVTVWASTQAPFRAQDDVAQALGIPPKNVRVITPFVGGGFGGKTRNQQAVEAARLARLTGKPVQVAWTRQEEFFYDTFRPAAVIDIESGLDSANRIAFWDYRVYFAGSRSSEPVYAIPHQQVLSHGRWRGGGTHPFNVGAWRAPGSNSNVFAMESHIDIMAQDAGLDPLEFRQKNLQDKRMQKVLVTAAEKFGHTFSKAPSGRGYGLACTNYLGTYLATMAEIKVDEKTGKIRVERVVCVQDMGEIINPEGATMQIEGCITMGLGYVLSEEIRFNGGEVFDKNFDTYEIPRFSWLPKIEAYLIDNPETPPQGCGEPAITPMGAVIANALYDAAGIRLFVLPMTPQRIKEALDSLHSGSNKKSDGKRVDYINTTI